MIVGCTTYAYNFSGVYHVLSKYIQKLYCCVKNIFYTKTKFIVLNFLSTSLSLYHLLKALCSNSFLLSSKSFLLSIIHSPLFMPRLYLLPSAFQFNGDGIIKGPGGTSSSRRFHSSFGTSTEICSKIWNMINPQRRGCLPEHLMWALLFLRVAGTESVLSSYVGVDEKTWRKWVLYFVGCISQLKDKVVSI